MAAFQTHQDTTNPPLKVPRHVAFVMDGNGRWATRQGLTRTDGHREGISNVERIAMALKTRGVGYMTIYMFSTENWKRPDDEVTGIFELLKGWLGETGPRLTSTGVRIRHYGRRAPLSAEFLASLDEACAATPVKTEFVLGLAINYGGRAEIADAVTEVIAGGAAVNDIDESAISCALYTREVPDPDLIVRPGGELRLSNYLLWQAAYAELYFTQVLWPDFGEKDLDEALASFASRNRRYGGLST
jgi:undecaprenyl diphosphate synthase